MDIWAIPQFIVRQTAGGKKHATFKMATTFTYGECSSTHSHEINIHYMVAIPLVWNCKDHGDLAVEDDKPLSHHPEQPLCEHSH
jgi:hypothetical protein